MSGDAFPKPVQRLICMPADGPVDPAQTNKRRVVQADCGHEVYMAVSSIQMWTEKQVLAVCVRCWSKSGGGPLRLTPQHRREMVAEVGEEETQRRISEWGVTEIVELE